MGLGAILSPTIGAASRALKFNENHAPAGSPDGGQFIHGVQVGGSNAIGISRSTGKPMVDPDVRNTIDRFAVWNHFTLYHGTTSDAEKSILKDGLVPMGSPGADQWAMNHHGSSFFETQTDDHKHSVFATPYLDTAQTFAKYALEAHPGAKPVLFQINVPPSKSGEFHNDEWDYRALRHLGKIPPEWIKEIPFDAKLPDDKVMTDYMSKKADDTIYPRTGAKFYIAVLCDGPQSIATKFNPNHDEHGRFATAGAGQGIEFISPNVEEGLHIPEAVKELGSSRQEEVTKAFQQVDAILGLKASYRPVVGAWADGAENSVLSRITGNPTYAQLQTSAAMKGMMADQKAVVPFKVTATGPDVMYRVTVPHTNVEQAHDELSKLGMEFHTLSIRDNHINAFVYDQGGQLSAQAQKAGEFYGTQVSKWHGQGEFLGSWDSRTEGRETYQKVIDANIGPDQRGQWDRVYSDWRQTHPALKSQILKAAKSLQSIAKRAFLTRNRLRLSGL